MIPSVTSEVGVLRDVVLHRPGLELRRLTPANREQLLFDELVWVNRAQEEHDRFAELLRDHGVRVHLLAGLLAESLDEPEARAGIVERLVTHDTCGRELVDRVRGFLGELDPASLATHLIGGLTVTEVPGALDGFVGGVLGPTAFLLPPLPNAVFTRDPSAWIGSGVVLSPMSKLARQAERLLWRLIYEVHPLFRDATNSVWYGAGDRDYYPATIEGGDILVLSPRCVAVGLSERSHPIAVENLAWQLFDAGVADWVLAVDLPKGRGTMHLDTIMSVVDVDAVVLWPRALELLRPHSIVPGARGRTTVTAEPDLLAALARGLGAQTLRVVTTGEDEVAADREQWDDGNNVLALGPGQVVAYERNADTNRRLRAAGVDVFTIPSSELPRGRGGPRCMSCPLVRSDVGQPNSDAGRGQVSEGAS